MKLESFVSRSYVAQSPNADCEETINLFLERVESGEGKMAYSFYKSPGLKTLINLGGSSVRGLFALNRLQGVTPGTADAIWGISGGTATLFDVNGNVIVTRGPIPDDGAQVSTAASLQAFAIVTNGDVYYIDGVAPFLHGPITWFGPGIKIADVAVINEFFLFLDRDQYISGFFFSEPGDINGPTNSSLNFVPAEVSASKFIKLLVDRQDIWVFSSLLTQVFYNNSANDPNNPFAPNLSAVIPFGIAARSSAVSVNGRVCWLGKSKTSVGVAFTTDGGYVARRISNHAVEYRWSTYPRIDDAISWNFTMKGHPLWRIWFPSGDETWEYDFSTDDWRKVLSWDEANATYHAHLGQVACSAGSSILVGARNSGKVYTTSMDYLNDDGVRMRWLRRCPILSNENKRVQFPWFELDMQTGVGVAPAAVNYTARQEVEVVDLGISSDTIATTFRRTQFRWVKAEYPSASSFRIDIVAINNNAADKTVQILDSSSNVVASFTIPHGTSNATLFENVTSWAPSAADDTYRIKTPATTGVADVIVYEVRIVSDVNGAFTGIVIPLSSASGSTGLDQTAGGGDIFRTTSTVFTSLGSLGWTWKYTASEWNTIASVRFATVFTTAVVDVNNWGEVAFYDITAGSAVVTVDNKTFPDTSPTYKDITVPLTSLIDGHIYEVRIRRVGPVTFNIYFHKGRLQLNMSPWTKALHPLRCGQAGTPPSPHQGRLKMPGSSSYTPGSIGSRFIESFGTTDPFLTGKGSYIADGGLLDGGGSFSNVTASFLEYTSSTPASPYRSADLTSNLTAGNRYGIQATSNVNTQAQMLLQFAQQNDPSLLPVIPEEDPKVMIRWSNDWARTWSNEYQRSMGRQGEYTKRVIKRGTGIARQRVFEVSGSASVVTVINGCYLRDPGVRKT